MIDEQFILFLMNMYAKVNLKVSSHTPYYIDYATISHMWITNASPLIRIDYEESSTVIQSELIEELVIIDPKIKEIWESPLAKLVYR